MSDINRKSFTQSAKESLTPESSKTTGEKIKERITDFGDKIMGIIQPETTKSVTQQVSDKVTNEKDIYKKNHSDDIV